MSRPITGSMRGRPPTGSMARPQASRQGTGARHGAGARPGTVFGSVKVEDRPMTMHGLSGMKTAKGGSQRQVQDRTYWLGELRSKITELNSEIRQMEIDMGQKQEENNTFLMFEKRAETLATQISEIRGELQDYNTMTDRVNMNQDLSQVVDDLNALKIKNDRDEESLEHIFEDTRSKESEISHLEKQLMRQRTLTENRVQDMDPKMRKKYSQLKNVGLNDLDRLGKLQDELETLSEKQQLLESELSGDTVKLDAVQLLSALHEAQARRDQLQQEESQQVSPEQEQQQLLASVKTHNTDISVLERQSKELDEKIQSMQDELHQLDNDLEDQESDSTNKFRELQKRESLINDFMGSFDATRRREEGAVQQLHETVVVLLEQISKVIVHGENLPSRDDLQQLRDDLEFKEDELHKAEMTSSSLQGESHKLQDDLGKVEELHDKITSEKDALVAKFDEMTEQLKTYSDVDALRAAAAARKRDLEQEERDLRKRKLGFRDDLEQLSERYDDVKRELNDDDTHAQLTNLERKWQHLEQQNFNFKEYIAANSADCGRLKSSVLNAVERANRSLQEIYTKSSLLS